MLKFKNSSICELSINVFKRLAFTLAEILITLGIIGIIAAMTIPNIMSACNRLVTEIALKKTHAELQQVFKLSEEENGEFDSWDFTLSTADFVKQYIMPYMKLGACGGCFLPESENLTWIRTWYLPNGKTKEEEGIFRVSPSYTTLDGRAIKFKLVNDTGRKHRYLEMFVDVDGPKGRTMAGRDVFAFYRASYEGDYGTSRKTHTQVHMGTGENGGTYWRVKMNYVGLDTCKSRGLTCSAFFEANNFKFPKDYPIKF